MSRNKYSPEIKQAVVNDYFNGIPVEKICEDYGIVSNSTVYYWVHEAQKQDIKLPLLRKHVFRDQSKKDAVIKYYFSEEHSVSPSQRTVAKMFGLPKSTICNWIRDAQKMNPELKIKVKFTDEFKKQVVTEYCNNVDIEQIFTEYGHISYSTIREWVKEFNKKNPNITMQRSRTKYSNEIMQKAINDYFNNLPVDKICGDYGIKSKGSLYCWVYAARKRDPKLSLLRKHVFHDQSEKDAVIQYYFFGDNGFFPSQRELAIRFKIPIKTVDYWIYKARKLNPDLPKRRNKYSDEVKKKAISLYLDGESLEAFCEKYDIASIGTVRYWATEARKLNPDLPKRRNKYVNRKIR